MNEENIRTGANLKILRTFYNDKQSDLAKALHCSNSAIANYESGTRQISSDVLQRIANRYKCPVELITMADLSDTDFSNLKISWGDVALIHNVMFPIIHTVEAMKDPYFAKGYSFVEKLMDAAMNGTAGMEHWVDIIIESFSKSIENLGTIESAANLLWFFFMSFPAMICNITESDIDAMRFRKLSNSDFMQMILLNNENINEENEVKRRVLASELNTLILPYIRSLEKSTEYSDLAYYYSALRYIIGMVDTDYSQGVNNAIGIEMLLSLCVFGNKYAIKYLLFYQNK